MKAEINKRVELVQILLYLAQEQEKTVQYINNKTYELVYCSFSVEAN